MSTNHTQNYNLCQWEASDRVLREDFNADNAKLETALTRIEATAGNAKALAQQAKTTADAAWSPDQPSIEVGYYFGNGAANMQVELGFAPKAVVVFPGSGTMQDGYTMGGLGIRGNGGCGIMPNETGFRVYRNGTTETNNSGLMYVYLAFR